MSATTDIFSRCTPAITTDIDHCGTLTTCAAAIPTPNDLVSLFQTGGEWNVMGAQFYWDMELKFVQARQSALSTFLDANAKNWSRSMNVENVMGGIRRIVPYLSVKRKAEIFNNYWIAASGVASSADGTSPGDSTHWRMDFTSPTNIPLDINWFNVGERVFIRGIGAGGVSTATAYKVVLATIVGATIQVVMLAQNSASYLDAAHVTDPTEGIAVRGTANVTDFESFCAQPPGLISNNRDEFWFEWTRDSRCMTDAYKQWRDLIIANNQLYKEFFDLPEVEYNRQAGEDFKRRMTNNWFWGKALPNQTRDTLEDLADISATDLSGTTCRGKRANAIGIYEQHARAGRVYDHAGAPLSIVSLANELYKMYRKRKAMGHPKPKEFDLFMPSVMIPQFQQAMLRYWKNRGEGMLQMYMPIAAKVEQSPLGFTYRRFYLDFPDVWLNVMTDEFFDDELDMNIRKYTATSNAQWLTKGRNIWIMDWSKNYRAVLASNHYVNKTGSAQDLAAVNSTYMCVPKVEGKTVEMMTTAWTAVSEMPELDLILENIADAVPDVENNLYTYGGTCAETP